MILLQEIDNFLSWYCTQDQFIQHQVNDRNAYARTISEAEQGNRVKLDYPRMEWVQLPNSQLSDNNAEYEWEEMAVTLRVITKSIRNDWDAEREAMDDCKAALARMLKYITDVVKSGECCETDLLCLFDLSGSTIGYLDKATSGGDFVGAQLRLQFKKDFDVDAIVSGNYPPLYNLDENSVQVWDVGQQKFVWVAVSVLAPPVPAETDPVFSAWLATNPIPVIPTNVSAFANDAGYLTTLPSHNHDDRYYTESEVDTLLSSKQNTLGFTPENVANKAQPLGYASLDSSGKIPATQLPNSVMELQGNWNAATNTPTLADGTGNAGDVWEVTTAGTTNFGSGNISFNVGDWAVYGADGKWYNSRNSNEVTSVNGFTGTVNLVPTDAEMQAGTNDIKAASPKKIADWWTWIKTQAQTFAAKITFTTAPRFSSASAGKVLAVDVNKDLTTKDIDAAPVSGSDNLIESGGVFAEIYSTASTGAVVAFDKLRHYGFDSPITGNITGNYTNAKPGIVQVMVHNQSTEPTYGGTDGWIKADNSLPYKAGSNNYIALQWISGTVVIYSIYAN